MEPHYIIAGFPDSLLVIGGLLLLLALIVVGINIGVRRSLRKINYGDGRSTFDLQQHRKAYRHTDQYAPLDAESVIP